MWVTCMEVLLNHGNLDDSVKTMTRPLFPCGSNILGKAHCSAGYM